jgi:hypothetical protein
VRQAPVMDVYARLIAIRQAIASCSASDSDLALERRRFDRLALHAVRVQRCTDDLQVDFAPAFPHHVLEEVLAVERQCCPFFPFEFDEASRHLWIEVQHRPEGSTGDARRAVRQKY